MRNVNEIPKPVRSAFEAELTWHPAHVDRLISYLEREIHGWAKARRVAEDKFDLRKNVAKLIEAYGIRLREFILLGLSV